MSTIKKPENLKAAIFNLGDVTFITRYHRNVAALKELGFQVQSFSVKPRDLSQGQAFEGVLVDGWTRRLRGRIFGPLRHLEVTMRFFFSILKFWPDKEQAIVLEATKEYAVKSYSTINDGIMTECNFGGYQSVADTWCPSMILIEKRTVEQPSRLLERDYWELTQIDIEMPGENDWVVDFEYDTFVEDYRFGSSPLQYRYLPPEPPSERSIDLEELARLREDMFYGTTSGKQNCATGCLKYAFGRLGKDISWEKLAPMVHGDEKATSMSEMVRFVRDSGLTAITVNADLGSIRMLKDCEIILHFPQTNHYVLLGATDTEFVRIADLTVNNLYSRHTIEYLNSKWEGTALILSSDRIAGAGKLAKIDDSMLNGIVGAGCGSCTSTVQEASVGSCSVPFPGACGGTYTEYYLRKGCNPLDSGSCNEDDLPTHRSAPCIIGTDTGDCEGNGLWMTSPESISACS